MPLSKYVLENIRKNGITRYHNKVVEGSVYILASISISDDNAITYISEANTKFPSAIVIEKNLFNRIQDRIPRDRIIPVENVQFAWAVAADEVFKKYKKPARIAAVTGTNGKTSTAYFYAQMASILRQKAGYIGTLGGININNNIATKLEDTLTTPDAIDLMRLLSDFEAEGYEDVCIEASSHGILQHRIAKVPIAVAAFTNLTQEHLDYHKTMEDYYAAKAKLFTDIVQKIAILNCDDQFSIKIQDELPRKIGLITYGKCSTANFRLTQFIPRKGFEFEFFGENKFVYSNILGEYNAYNILCATAMLFAIGDNDIDEIIEVIPKIKLPPGRMTKLDVNLDIYVDFAHKPHALHCTLEAIKNYQKEFEKNEIWVIFGCGGDRDKTKRPMMGSIAEKLANHVIITDDNPRHEDPSVIRKEIISGMTRDNFIEIQDREKAIKYAIQNMSKNDILVIAGKGNEKYQVIGDEKIPFCDMTTAKNATLERKN